MPAFHVSMLDFKSWVCFQFQLSANVNPGRQQGMAQVLGFLPLVWETWIELRPPDCGLAQPQETRMGDVGLDWNQGTLGWMQAS